MLAGAQPIEVFWTVLSNSLNFVDQIPRLSNPSIVAELRLKFLIISAPHRFAHL